MRQERAPTIDDMHESWSRFIEKNGEIRDDNVLSPHKQIKFERNISSRFFLFQYDFFVIMKLFFKYSYKTLIKVMKQE